MGLLSTLSRIFAQCKLCFHFSALLLTGAQDVLCTSKDCPIFYQRVRAKKEYALRMQFRIFAHWLVTVQPTLKLLSNALTELGDASRGSYSHQEPFRQRQVLRQRLRQIFAVRKGSLGACCSMLSGQMH